MVKEACSMTIFASSLHIVSILALLICFPVVHPAEETSFSKSVTLTVDVSFIVNKETEDYTSDDLIVLEDSFRFFLVQVEKRTQQQEEQQQQGRGNIRTLQSTSESRRRSLQSAMLDARSVVLTNFLPCPRFSTDMFRFCRQVEMQYDVNLYFDDDDVADSVTISEQYIRATKLGIEDGTLQSTLNKHRQYQDSQIKVVGESQTVASEFSILAEYTDLKHIDSVNSEYSLFSEYVQQNNEGSTFSLFSDYTSLLTFRNSFFMTSTCEINVSDLGNIKTAIRFLVSQILVTFGNEDAHAKTYVNLIEDSVEVGYALAPCPTQYSNPDLFCKSAVYQLNLVMTEGDPDEIFQRYSTAIDSAILDGTLEQLLQGLRCPITILNVTETNETTTTQPNETVVIDPNNDQSSSVEAEKQGTLYPTQITTKNTNGSWDLGWILWWVLGAVTLICCCTCIQCYVDSQKRKKMYGDIREEPEWR